jgi:hypothetical protein
MNAQPLTTLYAQRKARIDQQEKDAHDRYVTETRSALERLDSQERRFAAERQGLDAMRNDLEVLLRSTTGPPSLSGTQQHTHAAERFGGETSGSSSRVRQREPRPERGDAEPAGGHGFKPSSSAPRDPCFESPAAHCRVTCASAACRIPPVAARNCPHPICLPSDPLALCMAGHTR